MRCALPIEGEENNLAVPQTTYIGKRYGVYAGNSAWSWYYPPESSCTADTSRTYKLSLACSSEIFQPREDDSLSHSRKTRPTNLFAILLVWIWPFLHTMICTMPPEHNRMLASMSRPCGSSFGKPAAGTFLRQQCTSLLLKKLDPEKGQITIRSALAYFSPCLHLSSQDSNSKIATITSLTGLRVRVSYTRNS